MLAGVAPLVVPAVVTIAAGVGIMDALLVIGTALAALIGTVFGLNDVIEGAQTTYHGTKKDGKIALNIVRDTLFSNNPDDYYFIEFMATAEG